MTRMSVFDPKQSFVSCVIIHNNPELSVLQIGDKQLSLTRLITNK